MSNNNKANDNIVLEEEMDENYEPSQQEIDEYAEWLGMDIKGRDADLMWIAKEGLKAPLPNPWKPCQTGEGEIFYFNFESGESVWDHPCDEHYRKVFEEEKRKRDERERKAKADNEMADVRNAVAEKQRKSSTPRDSAGDGTPNDGSLTARGDKKEKKEKKKKKSSIVTELGPPIL